MAYLHKNFNNIDDYKKPIYNLLKENFFSKSKNKLPKDNEIERTKEIIKVFDFKNGEEITKLNSKSDVILLADVFEKFVKLSTEEYGYNPLYCNFLPEYTYQSALKYTDNKPQTLQDKDLISLLENNLRGAISSVMGDRYVISDDNKKIIYVDAATLYGHSKSQTLLYDETEMWHGHPDLYMDK